MPLPIDPKAPTDFDFIVGDWKVLHRRLDARLANCTDWTEFKGLSSTSKTLGGFGNLEDNLLYFPEGAVRAIAVRSFCAATGCGRSGGSTGATRPCSTCRCAAASWTASGCSMPTTC